MTELITDQAGSITYRASIRRFFADFRRITTSGIYIPEIDGLRFIAISLILMCHVGNHVAQLNFRGRDLSTRIFDLGNRGVELFFVISGFVLAMPFVSQYLCAGPRVSLKQYFLRRVTRLEPPYPRHCSSGSSRW
jgi:peptidoglycan/LPS O-acetylase OafA/YrhL